MVYPHTKSGSADTGTQTEQRRATSDSCSKTSFRCKFLSKEDECMICIIVLLILHMLSMFARAMEIIHIPWVIILLPEILLTLFFAYIFVAGFVYMFREWRMDRNDTARRKM